MQQNNDKWILEINGQDAYTISRDDHDKSISITKDDGTIKVWNILTLNLSKQISYEPAKKVFDWIFNTKKNENITLKHYNENNIFLDKWEFKNVRPSRVNIDDKIFPLKKDLKVDFTYEKSIFSY